MIISFGCLYSIGTGAALIASFTKPFGVIGKKYSALTGAPILLSKLTFDVGTSSIGGHDVDDVHASGGCCIGCKTSKICNIE